MKIKIFMLVGFFVIDIFRDVFVRVRLICCQESLGFPCRHNVFCPFSIVNLIEASISFKAL